MDVQTSQFKTDEKGETVGISKFGTVLSNF